MWRLELAESEVNPEPVSDKGSQGFGIVNETSGLGLATAMVAWEAASGAARDERSEALYSKLLSKITGCDYMQFAFIFLKQGLDVVLHVGYNVTR